MMPTFNESKRSTSQAGEYQQLASWLSVAQSLTNGVEQRLKAEEVVISGVSGRFGEYDSVNEWSRDLYQQHETPTDHITEQFKMTSINSVSGEPQFEQLLKVVWQSILDADMTLHELKSTRTGVFVGVSGTQQFQQMPSSLMYLEQHLEQRLNSDLTTKSTLATRIAHHFEFKGPNQVYEVTRPQSLIALDSAVHAIRTGLCDYAIVAGISHQSEQQPPQQQTIGVVFLQRKTDAKRYYAKVLHSKVQMDMLKDGGRMQPTSDELKRFIQDVYTESKIDINQVNYVELHGQQETSEIQLVRDAFKTMRTNARQQLHIGSAKWNVGRLQSPTGIFNLIKVLVSIQRGTLPANIYQREQERELVANQTWIKMSDINSRLTDGLIALSSLNRGEAYVHTILEPNQQFTQQQQQSDQAVEWKLRQARQQEALEWAAKHARQQDTLEWATIQTKQIDVLDDATRQVRQQEPLEWAARQAQLQQDFLDWNRRVRDMKKSKTFAELFQDRLRVQQQQQQENVVPNYESLTSAKSFPILTRQQQPRDEITTTKRPIWFLIANIGAHWRGSIKDLLQIEQFRFSLKKSAEYLRPYGVDLMQLLTNNYRQQEDRIIHTSVIVPAIQIALVDVLKQLNVEPDGIVGYSSGEFVAAYVDQALTHEEAIVAAYHKGKIIEEANFSHSSVVMVGCTWEEAKRLATTTIIPALYMAEDLVAFTGPLGSVQRFTEELRQKGIYVKEIESMHVPLHSHQMAPIVSKYQTALDKIIRSPKQRSSKWRSTTLIEYKYDSYASAEYFVHNIVSAVRLYEVVKRIPANAITVELGPQYFLQPYLAKTLGDKVTYVNLMRQDEPNQLDYLLKNLSRVYGENVQADWFKVRQTAEEEQETKRFVTKTDKSLDEFYLAGYKVDGKMLYPASGYLQLVRNTLESQRKFNQDKQSVIFEDVEFHYQVNVSSQLEFQVQIKDTGRFEVTENGRVCVSGYVYVLDDEEDDEESIRPVQETTVFDRHMDLLGHEQVYILLAQKGYDYADEFQAIRVATPEGTRGEIQWNGKWVPYIEALLQMRLMSQTRGQYPSYIRSLLIDPRKHAKSLVKYDVNKNVEIGVLPVVYEPFTKTVSAGGIDIQDVQFKPISQQHNQPQHQQQAGFVPYFEKHEQSTVETTQFEHYIDEVKYNIAKIVSKVQTGGNQITSRRALFEQQQGLERPTSVLELVHEAANAWTVSEIRSHLVDQLHISFGEDAMFNSVRDSYLRSCLELFVENLPQSDMQTRKVKILEISPALHFTGSKVVQMLSAMPLLADKVELCYAPVGEISDHVWSEFQRSIRIPINRIDWTTLLPEQLPIQFDLVMFNGSVASIPFVDNKVVFKKWLSSFSDKLVKPQGFFMINEYVNQFDLLNHIQRLERVCSKQEQITYTFQSEQEWRKAFEQSTGFSPVALKSNPALSTLFLYRRQHVPTQAYPGSSIQRPVIKEAELHVNDFESLVWLDKAKQAINDATIERVWVISETAPTPIALLIVKQIRAQPKLDRLRFIFIADTPSSSVPLSVFYENIKRADLVMNVYKNTKWGSYSRQQETAALTTTTPTISTTPITLKDTIQSLSELRELIKNEITRRQQLKMLLTADEQQPAKRFVSLQVQPSPSPSTSSINMIQLTPSVSIKFEPTREVVVQQKQQQVPFSFNYAMAHYALITRGGLKPTHSVLIHDGFSAIGQIAISIALKNASQVYVTVRNLDEMKQLEKQFQQQQQPTRSIAVLRVILISDFEHTIMQMTAGQGVDIVFNNIDEKHQASFNVLCTNGRFLDVENQKGLTDSKRKSIAWELPLLNKPISYLPITADAFKEPENMMHWQKIQNFIKETKDIQQVSLEAIQLFEQTKNSLKSVAQQFKQPHQQQQQQQQTKFNLMPKRVFEKLNEFESRQTTSVVIVHSIEGHASMLKGLAKNMKFPVYGLQFTQEALKYDTIKRLAEFYLQQLDNRFPVGTGVHLIGYGFGGLVAVEMASRKPSRFDTLSFLDGPSRHQQQMKYVNFDYETQAQQESEWLWGFVNQYNTSVAKTHSRNQLVYILSSMSSTEKRIKYVVENFLLTSQFQFEQNDAEMAARAYIAKLKMAQLYRPSTELCFDELLIVKPAQRVVEAFQEDFDLTGVFNGRVHVQIVDGEHRTFLESTSGQQVAKILNEYLIQF